MTPLPTDPSNPFGSVTRTLYDIGQGFDSPLDAKPRLRRTLGLLRRIVPYDRCALLEVPAAGAARLVVEPDAPENREGLGRVLTRFLTVLTDEPPRAAHWLPPDVAHLVPCASHLAVPLVGLDRVLGVLFVSQREAAYTDDDLRLLSVVASQIAAYLTACRLHEQEAQNLTHIGRVSALGELTASLAHELNQPLTAILSNAQAAQRLLAADAVNLEEVREILKDIVTDDKRAGEMIHRLRGLIKKGNLEFVPLDLNEIVGEVAWLVRSDAILRNVSLSLEFAADLPKVRGDRVQLQQVVLNLVLNGLDAMPESCPGDRTLVIRTTRDSATAVTVAVQDSGTGIDDKEMDRMFDPPYTTKAGGLGMGLAIARTIVEAHGGRLGGANNVHGGATFRFTLPAGTEDER